MDELKTAELALNTTTTVISRDSSRIARLEARIYGGMRVQMSQTETAPVMFASSSSTNSPLFGTAAPSTSSTASMSEQAANTSLAASDTLQLRVANENSNSVSNLVNDYNNDKDGETPEKQLTPKSDPLTPISERKRRRRDAKDPADGAPSAAKAKCERRINEFFPKASSSANSTRHSPKHQAPSPTHAQSSQLSVLLTLSNAAGTNVQGNGTASVGSIAALNHLPTGTALVTNSVSPTLDGSTLNTRSAVSNLFVPVSDGSASNSPTCLLTHAAVQTDLSTEDLCKLEADLLKRDAQIADVAKTIDDLRLQLVGQKQRSDEKSTRCIEMIKRLLVAQNTMERQQIRAKSASDQTRLGQFRTERRGATFEEVWCDGLAFSEIHTRQEKLNREKEDMERQKKILNKRKPSSSVAQPQSKKAAASSAIVALNCSNSNDGFAKPEQPKEMTYQEWYEEDEILKLRQGQLKKEDQEIAMENEKLERERNVHIREMKRIQYEDQSSYNTHPILHKRYLLLNLLGKGGFSEVYRAYDFDEMRYVACKVHTVNKEWKDEKKANYVKHALREKDIHLSLVHPRIVKLFDVFSIDDDSFVTVLEFCEGNDLDFYLKQHKCIPEKEAKSLISQLLRALKYLNEIRPPIIHYDLKPANILLCTGSTSGPIKITDFGLAKIMAEDKYDPDVGGMDLTSQGAGTYWYLPPECFVVGREPPKISSKVDVWSVGVIFYQCLYGRRPFGHNQSQATILEENTILRATEVVFPNKPTVNPEAKNFIRCCLQYRKEDRYDVMQLSNHEYLRAKAQRSATPSNTSSPSSSAQQASSYNLSAASSALGAGGNSSSD